MPGNAKYVIVTRTLSQSKRFKDLLESNGFNVYILPTITVQKSQFNLNLRNLQSYDWIVFTSSNAVRFFLEDANLQLDRVKVAAIGKKSTHDLQKYGIHVDYIPTKHNSKSLGHELPDVKDKRVLFPRSSLSVNTIQQQLKARGATVDAPVLYLTSPIAEPADQQFKDLLQMDKILCLTFTSPSTIEGFMKRMVNTGDKEKALDLPALSIGPVTTNTLKQCGFKTIITSRVPSIEGMVEALDNYKHEES